MFYTKIGTNNGSYMIKDQYKQGTRWQGRLEERVIGVREERLQKLC